MRCISLLIIVLVSLPSCYVDQSDSNLSQDEEFEESDSEFFERNHTERILNEKFINTSSLSATWYGTAFMKLSNQNTAVLIDPFVSRASFFSMLRGKNLLIQHEEIERVWKSINQNIDAILVTHSHYDHVLDAGAFAKLCQCPVYGSASSQKVLASHGYTEFVVVEDKEKLLIGDFEVQFIPSKHSKSATSAYAFPGEVEKEFTVPGKVSDYRLGAVHSLHIETPTKTVVHHSSADFVAGMYDDYNADIVFLGITNRPDTKIFVSQVFDSLRPSFLVPIHYDDFLFAFQDFRELPTSQFREFVTHMDENYGLKQLQFLIRDRDSAL